MRIVENPVSVSYSDNSTHTDMLPELEKVFEKMSNKLRVFRYGFANGGPQFVVNGVQQNGMPAPLIEKCLN